MLTRRATDDSLDTVRRVSDRIRSGSAFRFDERRLIPRGKDRLTLIADTLARDDGVVFPRRPDCESAHDEYRELSSDEIAQIPALVELSARLPASQRLACVLWPDDTVFILTVYRAAPLLETWFAMFLHMRASQVFAPPRLEAIHGR
jgi:hypothetical protein